MEGETVLQGGAGSLFPNEDHWEVPDHGLRLKSRDVLLPRAPLKPACVAASIKGSQQTPWKHQWTFCSPSLASTGVTKAASSGPCEAISSWKCVVIGEMMGQVFWSGSMSARRLIPSASHLRACWRAGVSRSLFCSLLIGVIYCPNGSSSCGFAPSHQLNPDAGMKIRSGT